MCQQAFVANSRLWLGAPEITSPQNPHSKSALTITLLTTPIYVKILENRKNDLH